MVRREERKATSCEGHRWASLVADTTGRKVLPAEPYGGPAAQLREARGRSSRVVHRLQL